MASGVYAEYLLNAPLGVEGQKWDSDTFKVMLIKTGYTPDFDLEDFVNDISTNRKDGTTDQSLSAEVINIDTTNKEVEFDAVASVTFTAVGATGGNVIGVVIYMEPASAPTDATRRLVAYNEFTAPVVTNGSDIQVDFAADGIFKITYATGDVSTMYAQGIKRLFSNTETIDWDTDTIKAALIKNENSFAPTQDTHATLTDVVIANHRMDGTSDITLGGTSKAPTKDTTNNEIEFDVDPAVITWNSVASGKTVIGVLIYKDGATDTDRKVIAYGKFASGLATNGSNIQVTFHADGVFTLGY